MSNSDDVSRIHSKYSVTLLAPATPARSLMYSIIVAVGLIITIVTGYLNSENFVMTIGVVIGVLIATQILDSRIIRNKEYSKALHLSLYGNLIWLIISLSGIAAYHILSKSEISLIYIGIGMFIAASFRIGLLTTVLGVNIKKAWGLSLIQPTAMFLALIPPTLWSDILLSPITLGFGVTFMIIATVWSILTDRAGRPSVKSTHDVVQAYVASRGNNFDEMESIFETCAKPFKVATSQIRLKTRNGSSDVRLVLPEVHPGPYHPVGGSNIPFEIYQALNSSAMVMHSISDHALNLPSKQEVENYIKSLAKASVSSKGMVCTEPVIVQINKARVIGILFEKSAILFLSLSPHGMEDLPSYIKKDIEKYAQNRGYDRIMIVDCHNAMGEEISKIDSEDMLKAAKSCLDSLITKESYPIEFGYANSRSMKIKVPDLGLGGLGVLCLRINGSKYYFGWADSNNMENGVREFVVDFLLKHGYNLVEISTSDTHFSQTVVRTKQGYYQFGKVTKKETIADWFLSLAREAEKKIQPASFEIIENHSKVKVMGPKIFEDLTKALDNSLRISKIFMIGSVGLFVISLFL